jgi:serine/threonine protein kinase
MEPVTLVDRYQLQQKISSKSGRKTYRAIDLRTETQVIVKLLAFEEAFEWASLRLFEREVEVLKSLDHPNIPKYIDSFELNLKSLKGFGLVQTYIEVPSLEEHLQKGRVFSEADTRELAISTLEMLCYLHEKSPPVVHRDIKPSNMLLGDRSGHSIGQVYLVDFGAVQTVHTNNTITVVGTYGYMPPEQFGGRSSPVSDLYSLGATLLYVVTGQQPAELMTDDLQLDFGKISNISTEFEVWIRKMIASVPSQRFASARDAIEALSTNLEFKPEIKTGDFEQAIDSLYRDLTFKRSEVTIDFSPLSVNCTFKPRTLEIKVVEDSEALQYFKEWESSEECLEEWRILSMQLEGPGKLSIIELAVIFISTFFIIITSYFIGVKFASMPILKLIPIILGIFLVSRFDDQRAIRFENSFVKCIKIKSVEINEFNAIFTLVLIPDERGTISANQIIYIELEVDGFSSSEDSVRFSIKFVTQPNISYVISNLEQIPALEIASAIASWLEVDLHDRRITFDDQKLLPLPDFDRDSWKQY